MSKPTQDPQPAEALAEAQPVPVVAEVIRYTNDAQERIARQRQMSAEFPRDPDARPMTAGEMAVARRISPAALEKAVVMAETMPNIGALLPDLPAVRDAIAFELAYGGVRDEARAFARRVDLAILWKKHIAAKAVHGLYRMSKAVTTVDAGEQYKTHVSDMKRLLGITGRRKAVPSPDGDQTPATKK